MRQTKNWTRFSTAFLGLALTLAWAGCNSKSKQDTQLQSTISNRLAADPQLQGQQIQASVTNGVVTLTGTAQQDSQRQAAEQDANIPGVARVVDQIATVSAGTTPAASGNSGSSPAASRSPRRSQAAYTPSTVRVPAGTTLDVRLDQRLASDVNNSGQAFSGRLERAVVVGGHRVIPAGATVQGTVVYAHSAGHFRGRSELELRLTSISYNGNAYNIATNAWMRSTYARGKRTAIAIGGGAGLGALVGAIAGGGKGAAIGSAIGAGTGTAVEGVTHAPEVVLPAETVLAFQLQRSVRVNPASATLP